MKKFLAILFLSLTGLCSKLHAQGIPYFRNYSSTEYKGHNLNSDVIASENGIVYFANFEGLLFYDNAQWRMIHTPNISRITAVFMDSKGTLWTGGYNYFGYVKHDDVGKLTLVSCEAKDVFKGEVQWIWEKDGLVYFLASDKEVYSVRNNGYIWAPGQKVPEYKGKNYQVDVVINQVEDLENGLQALATNGDGVVFVNASGKELFRITEQNGLCSNNVNHIDYDRHGLLWGATDNGVFSIAFPSVYTHFTANEGLRGEVLAISELGNDLYAGTPSGLYRMNGKRFEHVGDITHTCWYLAKQDNTLLAATSNGTYRVVGATASRLNSYATLSLLIDGKGFYSGEMDGVYYNASGIRQKICDIEKVVKIMKDSKGTIWIQNLYGLIWKSKDGNTFEAYGSGDKEEFSTLVNFGNEILPISINATTPFRYPSFSYLDSQGNLWLTDNKGKRLYVYKDGNKEVGLSSLVYPLMDYSVDAMSYERLLCLGGYKGLNIIDNKHTDPLRDVKPHLEIRSVLLRGDSIIWGGFGPRPDILSELSSEDRHIVFRYSIDHPSLLLGTQYRTRLNNGNWSAWEFLTFEEYSSLTYGTHLFEVQARDAFGRVSEIVQMRFIIPSPFFLRWYMLLIYVLLLMLFVYRLFRLRLRKLENDKNRLEKLVKQRTKDVVRLEKMATVGKLTQGLIDRILNPLNYINNFAKLSEGLVRDVKANVEDEKEHMNPENYEDTIDVLDMLKGNLEKVGEHGANTTRTLKAMEEMLKDRSGGIVPMSLTTLLLQDKQMLLTYFEKDIAQYHINTIFDFPEQEIRINGNGEQLSKTIMNILGNAVYAVIKKSQRQQYQPEIKLQVSMVGKNVQLLIHDNGIGIEQTIINKIFDPFFTTKTTGEASGIGLYLSHEIVQNHGGEITVQSEKNHFTAFTIILPTL